MAVGANAPKGFTQESYARSYFSHAPAIPGQARTYDPIAAIKGSFSQRYDASSQMFKANYGGLGNSYSGHNKDRYSMNSNGASELEKKSKYHIDNSYSIL